MDTLNANKNGLPNKGTNHPFYEPPPRRTSVDIINEARLAIRDSQMADNSYLPTTIKPLQTQRPFTPREKERILFGKKAKANRPPSSFSLRYLQTEADISIPPTTPENDSLLQPTAISSNFPKSKPYIPESRIKRSNSIAEINENKIFNVGVKETNLQKIKLPSLDLLRPLQKKRLYKNTYSLDNLPEDRELTNETKLDTRNAFSSPQERTDYNENLREDTPFGRPSKQRSLSQCLLLEPQNLSKIFENKQIIENSETLFVSTGYFNKIIRPDSSKTNTYPTEAQDVSEVRTSENVMNLLNIESSRNYNDDTVIELLNELYDCMDKEKLLSSKISSKMKIYILKCLYKFVDSSNEKLLLAIGRIILAMKVTGNNLSGVCKLIFKVSKNDKNDNLFFQRNTLELFIDALGRSSPLDDAEACIYGYGSIKFLTMNTKLLQKILSLGILPLMVLHIKLINNAKIEKNSIPDQTNHVLFQLTGALRNLACNDEMYETFVTSQAISQLCQALELFIEDSDIISNISRTLSTISTNDNCCEAIAEHKNINGTFIQLFRKYSGNEEIIVRLAYAMGNIVAKLDNARIKFYEENDAIKSLLYLWEIYLERTLKNCSLKLEVDDKDISSSEDVMIKIIRIIANIAINPEIGKTMNDHFGKDLIDEFLKVLISNPFKKNEELVLSVLSTLNNLSFYYTADFDLDIFHIKQIDIMEAISEYTTCQNKECVIESMRILGNLSRSKLTRNYIMESSLFNTLLSILEKDDINLLRTTIGVFVNLMADSKNRLALRNKNGVFKLIEVLNNHGQFDWSLAMLVCQVLWNFCIDSIDLYELITDAEIQQLMAILVDYLDEEKLFGISSPEEVDLMLTQEYIIWEEFANVATNLLEKIEQFLDTIEQIPDEDIGIPKMKDSSTNISFAAW